MRKLLLISLLAVSCTLMINLFATACAVVPTKGRFIVTSEVECQVRCTNFWIDCIETVPEGEVCSPQRMCGRVLSACIGRCP